MLYLMLGVASVVNVEADQASCLVPDDPRGYCNDVRLSVRADSKGGYYCIYTANCPKPVTFEYRPSDGIPMISSNGISFDRSRSVVKPPSQLSTSNTGSLVKQEMAPLVMSTLLNVAAGAITHVLLQTLLTYFLGPATPAVACTNACAVVPKLLL